VLEAEDVEGKGEETLGEGDEARCRLGGWGGEKRRGCQIWRGRGFQSRLRGEWLVRGRLVGGGICRLGRGG